MFVNSAMKDLINEVFEKDFGLPVELQDILNEGFKKLDHELIFLIEHLMSSFFRVKK